MYKNILWIDDCDDNDAGDIERDDLEDELNGINRDDTEIIREYFGESYSDVNLVKEFLPAIEELNKNCFQYDLVIFDMNMKEGMESNLFDRIKDSLKENRVNVKENEWDEFCSNAGIYLYLYLLNKGYPNNRMVILTGNGRNSPQKRLEEACICVDKSNLVEKRGGKIIGDSEWINQYYFQTVCLRIQWSDTGDLSSTTAAYVLHSHIPYGRVHHIDGWYLIPRNLFRYISF